MSSTYVGTINGTSSNIAACVISCVLASASGASFYLSPNIQELFDAKGSHYTPGTTLASASGVVALPNHVLYKNVSTEVNEGAWADYYANFNRAIDQYNAGDIIKVPNNIKSEDEFFEWLKSV